MEVAELLPEQEELAAQSPAPSGIRKSLVAMAEPKMSPVVARLVVAEQADRMVELPPLVNTAGTRTPLRAMMVAPVVVVTAGVVTHPTRTTATSDQMAGQDKTRPLAVLEGHSNNKVALVLTDQVAVEVAGVIPARLPVVAVWVATE
jgi:hypothetical protein